MKIATSTGDFSRVCRTEEEKVLELYKAGFRYIDMAFPDCNGKKSFLFDENWRENMKKLRYFAESLGMKFVQAHAPGDNAYEESYHDLLVESINRSIEACSILGIDNIVVHGGWKRDVSKEQYFIDNREYYRLFVPYMEKFNVNVLTENSTDANMHGMYTFFTGREMADFCDFVDHPLFHACWDTGHANCEGHQYEDLVELGNHLHAVHINDNRGSGDEHLTPFFGTMSTDDIMHGLIDNGFKGYFTLEAVVALSPSGNRHYKRRRSVHEERLLEPPLIAYQKQEALLYEIAKYILESYDMFEE